MLLCLFGGNLASTKCPSRLLALKGHSVRLSAFLFEQLVIQPKVLLNIPLQTLEKVGGGGGRGGEWIKSYLHIYYLG